jgi:hypothetical protein
VFQIQLGVTQERRPVRAVIGKQGQPEAGRDSHRGRAEGDRARYRRPELGRHRRRVLGAGEILED